jgi:hypothetical protein
MIASLTRPSRVLINSFPITTYAGHREYGETDACPGSNLLPKVVALRAAFKLAAPAYRKL